MVLLYAILIGAFLLRLSALFFGLPYTDVFGDEIVHTVQAFKMMDARSLIIPFGDSFLPPLFSFMLMPIFGLIGIFGKLFGIFGGLADYKEFVLLYKELFLIPGRIISALFGTAAVYFSYLLAEKIFNRKIALLSAFLLAINFLHIHDSQIGHIWSPIVFFAIAGAYCLYSLYATGQRKWYFWSALAVGLGYAVGQIPILLYLAFLPAHFLYTKKNGEKFWNKKFIEANLIILSILLIFTVFNAYTVYKHAVEMLGSLMKIFGVKLGAAYAVSEVVGKTSLVNNLRGAFQTLFFTDPLLLLLGVLGVFLLFKRNRDFIFVLLAGLPFLFAGTMILATNFTYRYVLPALPFLAILTAYFIFYLSQKISSASSRKIFLVVSIAVISVYPLITSLSYSFKITKPYTVSQGVEWFYANVPSGAAVVSDTYLNPNKESIKFLEGRNQFDWVDSRRKYLLNLDEEKYPQPNYFLIDTNLTDALSLPPEERKADYYFISFYGEKEEGEKQKMLDAFAGEKEMTAKFYPKQEKESTKNLLNFVPQWAIKAVLEQKYIGPHVEIYKSAKR
jgi:hypothetical protein